MEKVVSYCDANNLDLLKGTILLRKPYATIMMVNLLEQNLFDYSLSSEQDYAYLSKVANQVSNVDIDILTAISKEATIVFQNFVRKVYELQDKQDLRYVHGCQLIH